MAATPNFLRGKTITPDFLRPGPGFLPPFPLGLDDVGDSSKPTFGDIDGDGDLDAFIGESNGNTIFFENTGSSASAAFAPSSANPFGLGDVGKYSTPTFADLDGDGDLDAFIGETSGNTFFFENSGCGNGGLGLDEECDDGNIAPGDSCSAACLVELPFAPLDVDLRDDVSVPTDIVYVARRLLSLDPVPPRFRAQDPTIPPDSEISARIDALL